MNYGARLLCGVRMSRGHCSRVTVQRNWSRTHWKCLGVCRCLEDTAQRSEMSSGGTGSTLTGNVRLCPDVWKTSPEQCLLDIWRHPDTSNELRTNSSRLHLRKTDFQTPSNF